MSCTTDLDTQLTLSEMFESWQGEGNWAGQRTTFIRLFGCDVGCNWCDTGYGKIDVPLEKIKLTVDEIVTGITTNNITITGGEPMLFQSKLLNLIEAFKAKVETSNNYPPIRIETSGSCHDIPDDEFKNTWITFSPKDHVSRKTNNKSLDWFWENYSELKIVVDREPEFIFFEYLWRDNLHLKPLFFQPNYYNFEQSMEWCKELTTLIKYARISLQTHKIIGVR
jgi:organic radical activating enzyme